MIISKSESCTYCDEYCQDKKYVQDIHKSVLLWNRVGLGLSTSYEENDYFKMAYHLFKLWRDEKCKEKVSNLHICI